MNQYTTHTTARDITICNDNGDEPNETFNVTWGSTGDAFDGNSQHRSSARICTTTVTIVDDDEGTKDVASRCEENFWGQTVCKGPPPKQFYDCARKLVFPTSCVSSCVGLRPQLRWRPDFAGGTFNLGFNWDFSAGFKKSLTNMHGTPAAPFRYEFYEATDINTCIKVGTPHIGIFNRPKGQANLSAKPAKKYCVRSILNCNTSMWWFRIFGLQILY